MGNTHAQYLFWCICIPGCSFYIQGPLLLEEEAPSEKLCFGALEAVVFSLCNPKIFSRTASGVTRGGGGKILGRLIHFLCTSCFAVIRRFALHGFLIYTGGPCGFVYILQNCWCNISRQINLELLGRVEWRKGGG